MDATGLIVNPSFQTKTENDKGEIVDAASADGWLVESLKGGSGVKDAKVYEIFSDSSEVYQPLYNAPAGYYRVVMNGFYRAGGFIDAGVARRDSADAKMRNCSLNAVTVIGARSYLPFLSTSVN